MIKVLLTPERDSYNSFPQEIEFEIYPGCVSFTVGDRDLVFSKDDFRKLIKVMELEQM